MADTEVRCPSKTVWYSGNPPQEHVVITCSGPLGHKIKDGSLHRAKPADSKPQATVMWDDPPPKDKP